jgi:hypothetical protein
MKIIFASYACCARVIKEGIALIEAGHNVIFIQQTMSNWDLLKGLPLTSFYGNVFAPYSMPKHFASKLSLFTDIDIIHVHNEPSWFGYIAKEVFPDMPVIFDAHDLDAVRYGKATIDERKSIGACDAIIFPSKRYQSYCCGSKDFTKYKKKKYTSFSPQDSRNCLSGRSFYQFKLSGLARCFITIVKEKYPISHLCSHNGLYKGIFGCWRDLSAYPPLS